jgi:hypothetical protein
VAIAIAAAVLAYAIGPALLAPARRAERDRLRARLGCGQEGCPRCPQPGRNREAPAGNRP